MNDSNESACPCCGAPVSALDVLMDEFKGIIAYNGVSAHLTPKEWILFSAMLKAYPKGLSRTQMMDALYQESADAPEPKIIDVFICKLRKKLAETTLDFETDWGLGYRLMASDQIAAARNRYAMKHRRRICTQQDLPRIRLYRKQGLSVTDIARRLDMTFKAIMAGMDEIAAADESRARAVRAA